MFKKSIFLLFAILPSLIQAQYATPNNGENFTFQSLSAMSGGVVTVMDNVVLVTEDLTISVMDSLTVNDDLTVQFSNGVLVTVEGGMFVNSNSTFTSESDSYEGFRFEDGSHADLIGATFEYGGGFRVITPFFEMENCIVRYQGIGVSTGGAISFSSGMPTVSNSEFLENESAAISGSANIPAAPQIFNCTFISNNQGNTNRPQINLGPSGADTTRIVSCTVIGNTDNEMAGGIACASFFSGVESHAEIIGNTITNNRYGIAMVGSGITSRIEGNLIVDNNIQNDPMLGGSGININGSGENSHLILGNEIRDNLWGITVQGEGQINMGDLSNESIGPGENIFADNGNGGEIFALYNNTPNAILAQGNCWIEGLENINEEDVEEVIFHIADDATLGEVDFSDFDCATALSANENNSVDLPIVYPNPASDFLSVKIPGRATQLGIYDLNGRLLREINGNWEDQQVTVNLSDMAAGMYLIEVIGVAKSQTQKFAIR